MNQVKREYNGLGQLIKDWQAHDNAVGSLKVQYDYSLAPSGSNNDSRLTEVTYPKGRVVGYDYGITGGLNDRISRLGKKVGSCTPPFLAPATRGYSVTPPTYVDGSPVLMLVNSGKKSRTSSSNSSAASSSSTRAGEGSSSPS